MVLFEVEWAWKTCRNSVVNSYAEGYYNNCIYHNIKTDMTWFTCAYSPRSYNIHSSIRGSSVLLTTLLLLYLYSLVTTWNMVIVAELNKELDFSIGWVSLLHMWQSNNFCLLVWTVDWHLSVALTTSVKQNHSLRHKIYTNNTKLVSGF